MRPNRTLPLALPLALLASLPLLSGCFDEELESVDELLEAIGPELPEGVSVNPDGSIVIDKGLAADGDPLADGSEGFTCDDIGDCWDKCEEHCYCKPRLDGEDGYCCCNGVENQYDCVLCNPGGCGEGGGGGGGAGDARLSCNPTTRGGYVWCRVTGGLDYDSTRFEWYTEGGSSHSGIGRSGAEWGGRATDTRKITVEISHIGGRVPRFMLTRTARVLARNWSLQTQHISPKNSSVISRWGLYLASLPTRGDLYVREGSGPWAGSYYLHGSPEVRALGMWIHSDLDERGPSYPIHAVDTICGLSNVWRDVHALNTTCRTVGVLNGFRGTVVRHEETHQNSLNKCIRIMNRRWLGHVEEATGDPDHVEDVLEKTWAQVVVADLADARLSKQMDARSNGDAHWYYGSRWWFSPLAARGHSGSDGC